MAADKPNTRQDRLAAALKENLKRRKTQARAKANAPETSKPKNWGAAPQAGLEDQPEPNPKSASKSAAKYE
jgi:hypothetical protein